MSCWKKWSGFIYRWPNNSRNENTWSGFRRKKDRGCCQRSTGDYSPGNRSKFRHGSIICHRAHQGNMQSIRVERIVVGLPLGWMEAGGRRWRVRALQDCFMTPELPVVMVDERFSSKAAEKSCWLQISVVAKERYTGQTSQY